MGNVFVALETGHSQREFWSACEWLELGDGATSISFSGLFGAAQVAQRHFRIQTTVLAIRTYGTLCRKCVNASTGSKPNAAKCSLAATRSARQPINATNSDLVKGIVPNSRHTATGGDAEWSWIGIASPGQVAGIWADCGVVSGHICTVQRRSLRSAA
jgi:hypothetical protein